METDPNSVFAAISTTLHLALLGLVPMHASQLSYPAPDSSDVAFAAVSTTLHLGARGKVKLLVRLHNKLTPGLPAEMILISEPFDVSQSKDSSVLPQYANVPSILPQMSPVDMQSPAGYHSITVSGWMLVCAHCSTDYELNAALNVSIDACIGSKCNSQLMSVWSAAYPDSYCNAFASSVPLCT